MSQEQVETENKERKFLINEVLVTKTKPPTFSACPDQEAREFYTNQSATAHLLLDFVFILIRITLQSSKRTREWEKSERRESSTVASARGKEIKKIHPSANCRIERIMGFAVEAWSVRFLVHIPQTPKLRNCANW